MIAFTVRTQRSLSSISTNFFESVSYKTGPGRLVVRIGDCGGPFPLTRKSAGGKRKRFAFSDVAFGDVVYTSKCAGPRISPDASSIPAPGPIQLFTGFKGGLT